LDATPQTCEQLIVAFHTVSHVPQAQALSQDSAMPLVVLVACSPFAVK
jgi:hypothetical protein